MRVKNYLRKRRLIIYTHREGAAYRTVHSPQFMGSFIIGRFFLGSLFANILKSWHPIFVMNKCNFVLGVCVATALSACATLKSIPNNFLYDTSLRGEQGFPGRAERVTAAEALLEGGVVVDPAPVLKAALPDKAIKLRQWGLRYFNTDWTRYQVILDADIGTGKTRVKCRGVSSDTPVGAPTLKELKANNGALLQDYLSGLVQACIKTAS